MNSKAVMVFFQCSLEKVYRFASNPKKLPAWTSSFVLSIRNENGKWIAETKDSQFEIEFVPENEFGVLDHTVRLEIGLELYNPVQVIKNGEGSDIMFTLFQHEGMTDEQFEQDSFMVK